MVNSIRPRDLHGHRSLVPLGLNPLAHTRQFNKVPGKQAPKARELPDRITSLAPPQCCGLSQHALSGRSGLCLPVTSRGAGLPAAQV